MALSGLMNGGDCCEWESRESVRSILILIDTIDSARIGDTIIWLSRFKYIQHYFPHAGLHVNAPSPFWNELALYLPHIRRVSNLPPAELDLKGYDVVLLIVDDEAAFLAMVEAYVRRHPGISLSVAFIYHPFVKSMEGKRIPFLKRLFEFSYPGLLVEDINRCEICLSEEEMLQAGRLLQEKAPEGGLIIYFDRASEFRKMLKMSVNVQLIKYLQSRAGCRLVLFDPFEEKKDEFYGRLGVDMEKTVLLKGLSVRQACAVMADKRVVMILGPCTGLMHAASGVYNFLLKKKLRDVLPAMIVFTGVYEDLGNAGIWWEGRLADCIIIKATKEGDKKLFRLDEVDPLEMRLQKDILPCKEYTFDLIREYIELHYVIPDIDKIGHPLYQNRTFSSSSSR